MIKQFHFWIFMTKNQKHFAKIYAPQYSLQHYPLFITEKVGTNLSIH